MAATSGASAAAGPRLYSDPPLSPDYHSSDDFHPRAMRPLYGVTRAFAELLLPQETLPDGLVQVQAGGEVHVSGPLDEAGLQLLQHYMWVAALVAVAVLFAALLPLTGLLVCCCRCCCASRPKPHLPPSHRTKRRAACRRALLGFMLAAVATGMLFGVVCAFVTNEYMQEGTNHLPDRLQLAANDTKLYLNNTRHHLHHLLITNFKELQDDVDNTLNQAGKRLVNNLKIKSNAGTLDNLTQFSNELSEAQTELEQIQHLSADLQEGAEGFRKELHGLKDRMDKLHERCKSWRTCQEALDSSSVTAGTNFSQLPNIAEGLKDVEHVLINGTLQRSVLEAQEQMHDLERTINQKMEKVKPRVRDIVEEVRPTIEGYDEELGDVLGNITEMIEKKVDPALHNLKNLLSEYSRYRYYADTGASSALLLVVLLLSLGLLYGFCGKPPLEPDDASYGEDCCSKQTGARWMSLACVAMFCLGSVLALVALLHLALGLTTHQAVCRPMRPPRATPLLTYADSMMPAPLGFEGRNLSQVLRSCNKNESAYTVLGIDHVCNISRLLDLADDLHLDDELAQVNMDSLSVNVVLLTPDARRQLQLLRSSDTLSNLTAFSAAVAESIVQTDLEQLAKELDEVQTSQEDLPNGVKNELKALSADLRRVQRDRVDKLEQTALKLNYTALALHNRIRFEYSNLSQTIDVFITQLDHAQKDIGRKELLREVSDEIKKEVEDKVKEYLQMVVEKTQQEVGACGPLSKAFNASLVAVCDEVLLPLNGWWVGTGWCLLLFIPALVLASCLSSMYRKTRTDRYMPTGPDMEYLYDAYSDRDNIPLASGVGKKRSQRRYHDSYHDNIAGGGTAYEFPSRRDHDTRYADMAPKHWELPNGAPPPRYLGPEYERPPPYYYPGPGSSGSSSRCTTRPVLSALFVKLKGNFNVGGSRHQGSMIEAWCGLPRVNGGSQIGRERGSECNTGNRGNNVDISSSTVTFQMEDFNGLPRVALNWDNTKKSEDLVQALAKLEFVSLPRISPTLVKLPGNESNITDFTIGPDSEKRDIEPEDKTTEIGSPCAFLCNDNSHPFPTYTHTQNSIEFQGLPRIRLH